MATINEVTLRQSPSIEKTRQPHRELSGKNYFRSAAAILENCCNRRVGWCKTGRGEGSKKTEAFLHGSVLNTGLLYRPVKTARFSDQWVACDERRRKKAHAITIQTGITIPACNNCPRAFMRLLCFNMGSINGPWALYAFKCPVASITTGHKKCMHRLYDKAFFVLAVEKIHRVNYV